MNEKVKGKVKGADEDALNRNQGILDRIAQVVGAKNDAGIAKILDIKPQNIVAWKKTGVPDKWIITISKNFGCSVNFLLLGEGGYVEDSPDTAIKRRKFDPPPLGEAVDRLNKVLSSGDESIVSALVCNLIAFQDAVETKQETRDKLSQIEKKYEDLEAENARLKDELGRFDKILDELSELKKAIKDISRLYHESARPGAEERRNIIHHLGKILSDVGINGNQLNNNL